ncbi:nucleoside/nucleotide kinase family protein [Plantibacter sp. Mn2098]|uniref:nucleoside/nucleotide kinase family protein n=1 Tax=Plantibacter sp. Mn2098 TaxID=3395266 RepID=UPI003BF5F12D
MPADPFALAERVRAMNRNNGRILVGIAGPPGTGKSTLVMQIAQLLVPQLSVAIVPMDGFHLSNRILEELGRLSEKGASDTFDDAGYAALIARIRAGREETVYAPDFDHGVGEPIAGSIAVPRSADVVLTEGNYLLLRAGSWPRAREALDETWYLHTPAELRLPRLVARHIVAGKSAHAAEAWVTGPDERNARVIEETERFSDLTIVEASE